MSRIQPLFPLLGPLTVPRRAACQQLFRFSAATRLRVEQPAAPASSTPPPPPSAAIPSEASKPSPEAPSPARAAGLAATEAVTEADSAQSPAPKPILPSKRPRSDRPKPRPAKDTASSTSSSNAPTDTTAATKPPKVFQASSKAKKLAKPLTPTLPQIQLPPPKYHVARSTNKNLPIYTDFKRGGNLHLTTIRKITGDLSALRDELRVFLNKKDEDVKINSLTQHVIVKGHHVPEITEFLRARGM